MSLVVVSPAAARDLAELREFLAQEFGESIAIRKLSHLHRLLKRLESFPQLGRRRDSLGSGLRSLAINPNVVVYQILTPDLVDILRILDGRQDLEAMFRSDQTENEP
jgi:toxin ParE1/3/4